jgi:hypothetical protein
MRNLEDWLIYLPIIVTILFFILLMCMGEDEPEKPWREPEYERYYGQEDFSS